MLAHVMLGSPATRQNPPIPGNFPVAMRSKHLPARWRKKQPSSIRHSSGSTPNTSAIGSPPPRRACSTNAYLLAPRASCTPSNSPTSPGALRSNTPLRVRPASSGQSCPITLPAQSASFHCGCFWRPTGLHQRPVWSSASRCRWAYPRHSSASSSRPAPPAVSPNFPCCNPCE